MPVYGCAGCLTALHERLTRSLEADHHSYELVFVDDRSRDGGWEVLERLAARDPHVRAFRLSRNFGQDAAITAGLAQARGDWAVVMDCDLRRRPRTSPVSGPPRARATRWCGRSGEAGSTRPSAARTSRLYRRLTMETDTRPDYSNLSLMSRRVIDAFLRLRDRDREFTIALDWLGFDSTAIEIEHHERHDGESGYTLGRLVRVALDGMFFRSTVLLRLVVLVGFLVALVGIVVAVFEVVDYFAERDKTVPGYTSLAVLLLLLAGFIIVSVGVVGLYVGRIFEQVKDRPLFLIDREAEESPASVAAGPASGATATPLRSFSLLPLRDDEWRQSGRGAGG